MQKSTALFGVYLTGYIIIRKSHLGTYIKIKKLNTTIIIENNLENNEIL